MTPHHPSDALLRDRALEEELELTVRLIIAANEAEALSQHEVDALLEVLN